MDQASAQIAASALVTADQLLALKPKEELALGGGVNGVLSPSGMTTVLQRLKFQTSKKHSRKKKMLETSFNTMTETKKFKMQGIGCYLKYNPVVIKV